MFVSPKVRTSAYNGLFTTRPQYDQYLWKEVIKDLHIVECLQLFPASISWISKPLIGDISVMHIWSDKKVLLFNHPKCRVIYLDIIQSKKTQWLDAHWLQSSSVISHLHRETKKTWQIEIFNGFWRIVLRSVSLSTYPCFLKEQFQIKSHGWAVFYKYGARGRDISFSRK